jgi:hypothetical protein
VSAIKFELKNLMSKNFLPGGGDPAARGKGTPFTVFFCRDDKSLWISDAEGNLISLSDLLGGVGAPRAFPAQGCAGRDGAPGRDGADGKSGRDGKDSTVPGPASTVPGPQAPGIKGDRGERGPAGPDTISALEEFRTELIALRALVTPMNAEFHKYLEASKNAALAREGYMTVATERLKNKRSLTNDFRHQ